MTKSKTKDKKAAAKSTPAADKSPSTVAAQLLTLSSQLWDDLASKNLAAGGAQLWAEHVKIRAILDKMNEVNTPAAMFAGRGGRQSTLNAFRAWCAVHAVEMTCVDVMPADELGVGQLGLRTTKSPIGKDEVLARVPRAAMITWDDATEVSYLSEVRRLPRVLNALAGAGHRSAARTDGQRGVGRVPAVRALSRHGQRFLRIHSNTARRVRHAALLHPGANGRHALQSRDGVGVEDVPVDCAPVRLHSRHARHGRLCQGSGESPIRL